MSIWNSCRSTGLHEVDDVISVKDNGFRHLQLKSRLNEDFNVITRLNRPYLMIFQRLGIDLDSATDLSRCLQDFQIVEGQDIQT